MLSFNKMFELTMCQIGKRDEVCDDARGKRLFYRYTYLQKEVFFIVSSDRFYGIRDIDPVDSE